MDEERQRTLSPNDARAVADLITHQRGRIRMLKRRGRRTEDAQHLLAILLDLQSQLTGRRRDNVVDLHFVKRRKPGASRS
jgi:hypothetical protein